MKQNSRSTKKDSKTKKSRKTSGRSVARRASAPGSHPVKAQQKRKSVAVKSYSELGTYDAWLSKQREAASKNDSSDQKPQSQSFLFLETTDKWLDAQRPRPEISAAAPDKTRTEGALVVGSFDQWVLKQVAEKEKEADATEQTPAETEPAIAGAQAPDSETPLPSIQQGEGVSA